MRALIAGLVLVGLLQDGIAAPPPANHVAALRRSIERRVNAAPKHRLSKAELRPRLKVVMRLLDKARIRVSVRQLGLGEDDFRTFQSLIKRPNGIILVTGPTGSGKTTTLYAALNELNRPDRKIITAEDLGFTQEQQDRYDRMVQQSQQQQS